MRSLGMGFGNVSIQGCSQNCLVPENCWVETLSAPPLRFVHCPELLLIVLSDFASLSGQAYGTRAHTHTKKKHSSQNNVSKQLLSYTFSRRRATWSFNLRGALFKSAPYIKTMQHQLHFCFIHCLLELSTPVSLNTNPVTKTMRECGWNLIRLCWFTVRLAERSASSHYTLVVWFLVHIRNHAVLGAPMPGTGT